MIPLRIGRYRLTARLGAGGMGVVYLGLDTDGDGSQVAVKVLRPELADDPEFRARFSREVASLMLVRGECTVQVIEADTRSSQPFMVTEDAAGPSLSEYIDANGPLGTEMLYGLATGLAEALTAIHAAGVVHRDLKPSNVILGQSGPKVIDFGIAQTLDATSVTKTGMMVGSAGFMAPEQVTGRACEAADIFAWAVTVAYAASGQPPFGTGESLAIVYRILHGSPDVAAVPPTLQPLVMAALAKDPQLRPTAHELLDRADRPGCPRGPSRSGCAGLHLAVNPAPSRRARARRARIAPSASPGPGAYGSNSYRKRAWQPSQAAGRLPPLRARPEDPAVRPAADARPGPAQPPDDPDRGAGRRGGRRRRPGIRAADGPRHQLRPADREPAGSAGHHHGRPGTYPGQQPRGVFQALNRVVASGGTIVAMGSQASDGVVRQQFFVSSDGGKTWRLASLHAARRGPGPARPSGDAAGRRPGRVAGDRPAGHLDQPGRDVVDARVDPGHIPPAARRLGVGDHQDRRRVPGGGQGERRGRRDPGGDLDVARWPDLAADDGRRPGAGGAGEAVQSISYATYRGADTLIAGTVTAGGATYSGAWLSTDGGSAWTRVSIPVSNGAGGTISGLAFDNAGLIAVRPSGGTSPSTAFGVAYFSPNGLAWQYAGTINAAPGWSPSVVKGTDTASSWSARPRPGRSSPTPARAPAPPGGRRDRSARPPGVGDQP